MSQGDLTAELCSMLAVWLVLPFYLLAYLLTYSRADHSDSRGPLLGAARGGGVTFVAGAPAAQRPPRMPPSPPSPPSCRLRRRCRFRHRKPQRVLPPGSALCGRRHPAACVSPASTPLRLPLRGIYDNMLYVYVYSTAAVFQVLLYTLHNAYRSFSPPRAAHCEIHSDSHSTLVFFRVCCEILL